MIRSLWIAKTGLDAQQTQMDTISHNLANVGTNGYKRTHAIFEDLVYQNLRQVGGQETAETTLPTGLQLGTGVRPVATGRNFAQGNLQRTGRDFDLALYGDGFFAVESADGEVYTRAGCFHLSEGGVLVTEEGYPVAWEQLRGAIDPTGEPVAIDEEGNVRQGSEDVGRLRIVDFADKRALGQDRMGYWLAPRGARETPPAARVHQYALEDSNANGVEEMVAMIGVQRSFEVVAKALSAIDQSYQRLTRPF